MKLYCDPKMRQENSLSTNDVMNTCPLRLDLFKVIWLCWTHFSTVTRSIVPHVATKPYLNLM